MPSELSGAPWYFRAAFHDSHLPCILFELSELLSIRKLGCLTGLLMIL